MDVKQREKIAEVIRLCNVEALAVAQRVLQRLEFDIHYMEPTH